jgi:hypothetical protein
MIIIILDPVSGFRLLTSRIFLFLFLFWYSVRANLLSLAGIVLGTVFILLGTCLYINEAYYKRRFSERVYVD